MPADNTESSVEIPLVGTLQTQPIELRPIVTDWVTAFNTHNVPAIVSLYHDDAELFDAGMKRPRRGRAEIERWFTWRFSSMPTITYVPAIWLFDNEYVSLTWTTRGMSPPLLGQKWLSRPFFVDGVSIFSMREGRIQRQRGYYDHAAALEQILPVLLWLSLLRL